MSANEPTSTHPAPYGSGPFGLISPASQWRPLRDLIGEVKQSSAGNTVLTIGRENTPEGTWSKTGHIVMIPGEREELITALAAHRGEPAGQVQPSPVSFDQEAAVRWLQERHPDAPDEEPYTNADYLNIDHAWPGGGSDGQIDRVIDLINDTVNAGAINLGDCVLDMDRTTDKYGVLSGFRIIITTRAGVSITSDAMWASDLTEGGGGDAGAMATLRNAADVIAGLLNRFDKR